MPCYTLVLLSLWALAALSGVAGRAFQQPITADRYADGRVIVLAIDQPSFPASARAGVVEAAQRVVSGAASSDYLGLVVFPSSIAPTRDRQAVQNLLGKVEGGRRDLATPRYQISAADALLLRSGDAVALQTIVTRECDSAFNQTCRNEVLQDGSAIAEVLEQQNRFSLTALFATIDALASLPGGKTMVLLSAGLPMTIRPGTRPDQHADVARLAQAAAAANVRLHVLYLNGKFLRHFSPDYRKRHYAIFDDLRTFGTSVETFAKTSGGSFHQMEIEPDRSAAQVAAVISAERRAP
jgi:hypothetical protein